MGAKSDFLFAQPSALYGLARLLDLGATFDAYNQSSTPAVADAWAVLNDWSVVGHDLSEAFGLTLSAYLETEEGRSLVHRLESELAAR